MNQIIIRPAVLNDAPAACEVVRCSITELCTESHQNDQETLVAWLANKTVQNFERWVNSEQHYAVVADDTTKILGFGLMNLNGSISLLYVAPEARFQGVSKHMLAALEQKAIDLGMNYLTLTSTPVARNFYISCGYTLAGEPQQGFGVTRGYPMMKELTDLQNQ